MAQGKHYCDLKIHISGVTYEFYVEMMQLGLPFVGKETKITRFLHVAYETNKFDELLDFFTNTLNFKVSDFSGREPPWAWLQTFSFTISP